jgi:predicted NBD/HSP70 family sugar kinase
MPFRRTTILADADLLDRLDRHVRRTGWTKTAVIAAAVEAWLGAQDGAVDLPFLAVGRSGHGRLSLDARPIAGQEAGRRSRAGR